MVKLVIFLLVRTLCRLDPFASTELCSVGGGSSIFLRLMLATRLFLLPHSAPPFVCSFSHSSPSPPSYLRRSSSSLPHQGDEQFGISEATTSTRMSSQVHFVQQSRQGRSIYSWPPSRISSTPRAVTFSDVRRMGATGACPSSGCQSGLLEDQSYSRDARSSLTVCPSCSSRGSKRMYYGPGITTVARSRP